MYKGACSTDIEVTVPGKISGSPLIANGIKTIHLNMKKCKLGWENRRRGRMGSKLNLEMIEVHTKLPAGGKLSIYLDGLISILRLAFLLNC